MNTNDLKIFEAVAYHNSFTKAAEATFTVQSNVTARIRSLENEFGMPLFLRNSKKVTLTGAGEILMQYAKQIAHLLAEAKRDMNSTDEISGSLKIGCIETTMALKVPKIMDQFTKSYPNIDLEFKSAMRSSLINDVINYKLDAAFVSAPINTPGLEQLCVKEEQLVIIARGDTNSLASVVNNSPLKIVVFDQGCVFRARLETWLSSKGIIQYKSIVVNSLEGVINFVEAGMGISIMPLDIMKNYYPERNVKIFRLSKELATFTTVLIYRDDVPLLLSLQVFIEIYKKAANRDQLEP